VNARDDVRVGLTLPTFRSDPDDLLAVARAAEAAGLDGVFTYDHLFRDDPERPALEMSAVLGAVAQETERIAFGPLVARATMRPAATLAAILDTTERIAPGRLIVTLGTGDEQSTPEHEAYGLPIPDVTGRLAALVAVLDATNGHGYPRWIGGVSRAVWREAGAVADGWNRWGGTAERFAQQLRAIAEVRDVVGRTGAPFTPSWGGLVALGRTDDDARAKLRGPRPDVIAGSPATVAGALGDYVDAGATWVIAGPVDSSDPANAELLADVRDRLHSAGA